MSLAVSDLSVEAGGRTLLRGIDFRLPAGEVTAIVGPNGAGKSTLLRALAGDLRCTRGSVHWNGVDLVHLDDEAQAQIRAVVGQAPLLAFDFTARDVVEMGWLPRPNDTAVRAGVFDAVMSECDVQHLRSRPFSTLSGGEQQRVQYARALAQIWRPSGDDSPRWLLLDEPTANLDIAHGIALLESVRRWAARATGVLVVLHDLNLAARFADRLLLLHDGCQVAHGPPAAVIQAQTLSKVYGTPIHVEHHAALDRLVVLA